MNRAGFKVGMAAGVFVALTLVVLLSLPLAGLGPAKSFSPGNSVSSLAAATSTSSTQTFLFLTTTQQGTNGLGTSAGSNKSATEGSTLTPSSTAYVTAAPSAGSYAYASLYGIAQGSPAQTAPSSLSLISARPFESDVGALAPLLAAAIIGVAAYEIATRREKEVS